MKDGLELLACRYIKGSMTQRKSVLSQNVATAGTVEALWEHLDKENIRVSGKKTNLELTGGILYFADAYADYVSRVADYDALVPWDVQPQQSLRSDLRKRMSAIREDRDWLPNSQDVFNEWAVENQIVARYYLAEHVVFYRRKRAEIAAYDARVASGQPLSEQDREFVAEWEAEEAQKNLIEAIERYVAETTDFWQHLKNNGELVFAG